MRQETLQARGVVFQVDPDEIRAWCDRFGNTGVIESDSRAKAECSGREFFSELMNVANHAWILKDLPGRKVLGDVFEVPVEVGLGTAGVGCRRTSTGDQ